MIWILFYYNSLPDLPVKCPYFSPHIMHRDFLLCNPTNTGHYQYPRFETLSYDEGCHRRKVHSFLQQSDPDKYVLFYTRHTDTQSESKNVVVGYFKVGRFTKKPFGFVASDLVLLSRNKAIPISYKGRGVPTSWGHSKIKSALNRILQNLMSLTSDDISVQYQNETRKVMAMFRSRSGKKAMLETCKNCTYRTSCYWGKKPAIRRQNILNDLYTGGKTC